MGAHFLALTHKHTNSITNLHREVELCETVGRGIKWLDDQHIYVHQQLNEHWRAHSQHAQKNLGSSGIYIGNHKATVSTSVLDLSQVFHGGLLPSSSFLWLNKKPRDWDLFSWIDAVSKDNREERHWIQIWWVRLVRLLLRLRIGYKTSNEGGELNQGRISCVWSKHRSRKQKRDVWFICQPL